MEFNDCYMNLFWSSVLYELRACTRVGSWQHSFECIYQAGSEALIRKARGKRNRWLKALCLYKSEVQQAKLSTLTFIVQKQLSSIREIPS
jgi:hypothetical protein